METVRITHPKLQREAVVPKSAVPFWASAGWRVVAQKPAERPAAPTEQDKPESKPRVRRKDEEAG